MFAYFFFLIDWLYELIRQWLGWQFTGGPKLNHSTSPSASDQVDSSLAAISFRGTEKLIFEIDFAIRFVFDCLVVHCDTQRYPVLIDVLWRLYDIESVYRSISVKIQFLWRFRFVWWKFKISHKCRAKFFEAFLGAVKGLTSQTFWELFIFYKFWKICFLRSSWSLWLRRMNHSLSPPPVSRLTVHERS